MKHALSIACDDGSCFPGPEPGKRYLLYIHVPFCEKLCPYCSFNRYLYHESCARRYFDCLLKEMRLLSEKGFDFDELYIGGGTPTVMIDELCMIIDAARSLFSVKKVSCETNPNHLGAEHLEKLVGRVQRLSVGVQSFDDGLLHQMGRLEKYGSSQTILQGIESAAPLFDVLNLDMIFNFPAQTDEMLINDLACVAASAASQVTFYPLMVSPSVQRSLDATVGRVDYRREERFYRTICETLTEADGARDCGGFRLSSAWTFDRGAGGMIDEYVIDYEEYPAIGSGGISYLRDRLYVNTFSLHRYAERIAAGRLSVEDSVVFRRRDRMRYRFMMQLFGLRLDKKVFKRDFGCSVERGLPLEMAFMRASGAFATDTATELTLTPQGRYLVVVMMRQFFVGVNGVRDAARAALTGQERRLAFGDDDVLVDLARSEHRPIEGCAASLAPSSEAGASSRLT